MPYAKHHSKMLKIPETRKSEYSKNVPQHDQVTCNNHVELMDLIPGANHW